MKKIIKLTSEDTIPEGAKFLSASEELDHSKIRYEWRTTPGLMGILPIFGTETYYKVTPISKYFYYEVEVNE